MGHIINTLGAVAELLSLLGKDEVVSPLFQKKCTKKKKKSQAKNVQKPEKVILMTNDSSLLAAKAGRRNSPPGAVTWSYFLRLFKQLTEYIDIIKRLYYNFPIFIICFTRIISFNKKGLNI